jgi:hypothetical protein
MRDFWKSASYPSLEITTSIPKQGCIVDCVFCPQRVLKKVWDSGRFENTNNRFLSLDGFKKAIDSVPVEITIIFSGFTEPWLNREATKMLVHAHEKGHPVAVFTTGVGMRLEDIEIIKDIPFSGGPNRNFTLHLPDADRKAKHPINKNYIKVVEKIKEAGIQNLELMAMGRLHSDFRKIYSESTVTIPHMWHRAGNLLTESDLRPEILADFSSVNTVHHDKSKTCGCVEKLYHNVLLPNGDVSLCCMDYNLDEILGNLFTQKYEEIIPNPNTTFDLCMNCENATDPPPKMNTLQILLEKFINEPEDNLNKFWLGWEYEQMGHASSAMGYYLSVAENTDSDLLAYECLLRKAICFRKQGDREAHVRNSLLLAVSLLPERPEAHYLLSVLYEVSKVSRDEDKWQQMYAWARTGENISKNFKGPSLLTDVGYLGDSLFLFQQAVCLWWMGRFSDSEKMFLYLKDTKALNSYYQKCIESNLTSIKGSTTKINT